MTTVSPPKVLKTELTELLSMIQRVKTVFPSKTLSSEQAEYLSTLCTQVDTVRVLAKKMKSFTPRDATERKPTLSGITKPVAVLPKMCYFANWPLGEQHSRVDISAAIFKYTKDMNLQNPARKVEIIPDKNLTNLLSYNRDVDGPLEYTTVQKLIGRLIA